MTAVPVLVPAGAPALAVAPACETVHVHGLTGAETPCGVPAVTADLRVRSCGCVDMRWSYSCAICADEGTARGFSCLHCWLRTVTVLCTVPVGRG